jgi:hypothetical protein
MRFPWTKPTPPPAGPVRWQVAASERNAQCPSCGVPIDVFEMPGWRPELTDTATLHPCGHTHTLETLARALGAFAWHETERGHGP